MKEEGLSHNQRITLSLLCCSLEKVFKKQQMVERRERTFTSIYHTPVQVFDQVFQEGTKHRKILKRKTTPKMERLYIVLLRPQIIVYILFYV